MTDVYIGWADAQGLKKLETESSRSFNRVSQELCFENRLVAVWSVMDSSIAMRIASLLAENEYQTAWWLLQRQSLHLGFVA